ncbi:MAG TPA: copper amine oxidase N-terminal domain-containing protein [Armatimonadota bacterium]|nr:copper amine oxidase N-terminal domain-containing protein [Armatimonadota bacterium]
MVMKARVRLASISGLLTLILCSAGVSAPIQVLVNNVPVQFADQQPVDVQNHVLVPLRGVLEALGATVNWNPAAQTVKASRGATTVELGLNSRDASVNGSPVSLDIPAMMIGGRVMVPLRFISEALGADVRWINATQTVMIRDSNMSNAGSTVPVNGGAGTGTPLPVSNAVAVTNFNLASPGPFHPGDTVKVELRGTPGGSASFSAGGGPAISMRESTPGVYVGTYQVPAKARGENISVVGRLVKNGASSPLVEAGSAITISSIPPKLSQLAPAPGAAISNLRPTIYAILTPGSAPVNAASARITVNGKDVTPEATITPAFVSYTPAKDLKPGANNVVIQVDDNTGLAAKASWNFNIAPREGIKSLSVSPTSNLGAGDVLTVTMTGEPNGQAWFTIPGVAQRVPMTQTPTPGVYTGTYTARRGDEETGQRVVGHLALNGATFAETSTAPVTIWTKSAQTPIITSPADGAHVTGSIRVTGTADPDSQVHVQVSYKQSLLGIFATTGSLATFDVTADKQGQFETPQIPLGGILGSTSNVNYTITATETNPAGQQSAPATVQVHS